jgi:hypothetical protein
MITVRVLVALRPDWSVATSSMVSVAGWVVSMASGSFRMPLR